MSLDKAEPYTAPWLITDGTIVYAIDGAKVGSVREYNPRAGYIDIQKGWLFPKDFYVTMAAVRAVTGEGISLRLTSEELEDSRYDAPPTDHLGSSIALPDEVTHSQGADEFVEIRTTETPWDPDRPVVREDEQYGRLAENSYFPTEEIGVSPVIPPRP